MARSKRRSWPASSSTATTSATSMPEPLSALVITRRAEDAPIAAASRRSVNWAQLRSVGASGSGVRPVAAAWSAKARRAVVSPTMRPARVIRSPSCALLCGTPLPGSSFAAL